MKKVLIVDDQRLPRENMESLVRESGRYELAGSLRTAELAIAQCARRPVDLILMDVVTSGSKDGIEAAAEIKRAYPEIKIIITTSMPEESYVRRSRAAGVDSFWYKDVSPEELIDVMDRTMAGEQVFPRKMPVVKLGNAVSTDFTSREIHVLRLVCEGLETGEIADELGISVHTVKHHITSLLTKTGYDNRAKLGLAATKKNFIIPKLSEDDEDE